MIPIVDSIVQQLLIKRLKLLKQHPALIDIIFQTSNRSHKDKIFAYLNKVKVKVIFGYPREPSQLPCIAISHASETETPMALGDNALQMICRDLGIDADDHCWVDDAQEIISQYIDGTCMRSQTRIGLYADNADFIMYFSQIIKWCLLSSRTDLYEFNWVQPQVNTYDLRLESQFQPQYVYAKDIMFSMQHDNWYIRDFRNLELMLDIIEHPHNYKEVIPYTKPTSYSVLDIDQLNKTGTISMINLTPVSSEDEDDELIGGISPDEEETVDIDSTTSDIPSIIEDPIGGHRPSVDEEIGGRLPPLSDKPNVVILGKAPTSTNPDLSTDESNNEQHNTDKEPQYIKETTATYKVNFYTHDIPEYFKNVDYTKARDIVSIENNEIVIPHQYQWIFSIMVGIQVYNSKREQEQELANLELTYISEHDVEI